MPIRIFDELVSAFGGTIVDGNLVGLDASGFTGNLSSSVTDAQALADAVDALSTGAGTAPLTDVVIQTGTGAVNISNIDRTVQIIQTTITEVTITDSSIPDNSFFTILNQSSVVLPLNLSVGSGFVFGAPGSARLLNIPANTGVLFFVNANGIFPISNYNTATGGAGASALTLLNGEASTITKGTPVVVGVNAGGTLTASPATTSNLGTGVGDTAQQNRIYGFAGDDVAVSGTFIPVVDGTIDDLDVTTDATIGETVYLAIEGDGDIVLARGSASALDNTQAYGYAGYVTGLGASNNIADVYVNVDLIEKSHNDRLHRVAPDISGTPTTGQFAQWVDANTLQGVDSTAARYPDVAIVGGGPIDLVGNQVLYNIYRNRTAVADINTGLTLEFRLPSLQNAVDLAYLNRNDVFCFRNDGTNGNFRIRTFQVGTSYSDGTTSILVGPGQLLCITPAPSGAVWTILEFGQAAGISLENLFISDWYRDANDATAADNRVALRHRRNVVDGDIREHINAVTATNNPVTVRFESRNVQDDIAWINWWSVFDTGVPPLSAQSVEVTLIEIPIAITYIETNINNGYDFDFNDPGLPSGAGIEAITFLSGNQFRVELFTAIPTYWTVNDTFTISGNSQAENNGNFIIDAIAGDRLDITFTNVNGNGANSNTGASGILSRTIYADSVLVSHDLRQVNFNIYTDSARTNLLTTFPADWFSTDTMAANTLFAIAYNNDIETIGSQIAIQDDAGAFFAVKGGPRQSIVDFNNVDSYSLNRDLPITTERINIRTAASGMFHIPEYPDQLETGESRVYTISSDITNDDDDVRVYVGEQGNTLTFDEGITTIPINNGAYIQLELYNDGVNDGVRLLSPIQKTLSSINIFANETAASTAQINPLPISAPTQVPNAQNEDPNSIFINAGGAVTNKIRMQAIADYTFKLQIDVKFNGTEPTGLEFVTVTLMPYKQASGDGVPVALPQFSGSASLLFSRGGQTGSGAPQYTQTLISSFDYQGSVNETMEWRLEFGTFPSGTTTANINIQNFRWIATAQLGLN